MEVSETFEPLVGHAVVRFQGRVKLEEAVQLVNRTILRAGNEQIPRLLINATGLDGFGSPTLADRYFIVREWAKLAAGRVRIAMVVKEHMIDPGRFGVLVARNAGLEANVFGTEPEALEWLCAGDKD